MSLLHVCDRCGWVFWNRSRKRYVVQQSETVDKEVDCFTVFDLCEYCANNFTEFMKNE